MDTDRLPVTLDSFIGRESELAALARYLAPATGSTRLLTLTGAGGSVKTRLAVEAARRLAPAFADGAYFVSLAPIASPDLVPLAIAQTMGLWAMTERDIPARLADFFSSCEILLLLDKGPAPALLPTT